MTRGLQYIAAEVVYYVAAGAGEIRHAGTHERFALKPGSMILVPRGAWYSIHSLGGQDMILIGGPCPPESRPNVVDGSAVPANGALEISIFDTDIDGVQLPLISSDARLVIWPGVGADIATMNYVVLQPGEANVPHVHADSEDTIFILEGEGTVADLDAGLEYKLGAGSVVHVDPGTQHAVANIGQKPLRSVGGPCPPDYDILRRCGIKV
jgi:mannose-6-phosphate isomerase-like protein (cupin superfamily)